VINVDEVARGGQVVGDEVDMHIRGKLRAFEVFDEIEDDVMMW